jgi:hypothetical protein
VGFDAVVINHCQPSRSLPHQVVREQRAERACTAQCEFHRAEFRYGLLTAIQSLV